MQSFRFAGARGGVLSADDRMRDAPLLAEALAIEMTRQGQPKVTYEQTSQLVAIKEPSIWDKFFEEDRSEAGQVLSQVRKAAPINQNGNVYAMIHKSIQEYLVAKCLMGELQRCVESSRIGAAGLQQLCDSLSKQTDTASTASIAEWIEAVARTLEQAPIEELEALR